MCATATRRCCQGCLKRLFANLFLRPMHTIFQNLFLAVPLQPEYWGGCVKTYDIIIYDQRVWGAVRIKQDPNHIRKVIHFCKRSAAEFAE